MAMLRKYGEIVTHDRLVENRIQTFVTLSEGHMHIQRFEQPARPRAIEFTPHSYGGIQELNLSRPSQVHKLGI